MSFHTITSSILTTGDLQHGVSESGADGVVFMFGGVKVRAEGLGAVGIRADGGGDDVIVNGTIESAQSSGVVIGSSAAPNVGFNNVSVGATGLVLGQLVGVQIQGGGAFNRVDNSGQIYGATGVEVDGDKTVVVNSGIIESTNSVVRIDGNEAIVTNDGSMRSVNSNGFNLEGDFATVTNNGGINAGFNAIDIEGEGAKVENTGTIIAANGIVVRNIDFVTSDEAAAGITNSGKIAAETFGIAADGDDITIVNAADGEIRSLSDFGAAVKMDTFDTENQTLFNDGLLSAPTNAVLGGEGSETVVNRGTIEGAVLLRGGDDVYRGAGGSVDGAIDGGAGEDVFRGGASAELMLGGTENDNLGGGGGADRLFGQDGDDRIDGGEGADKLNGGAGSDRIAGGAGNDIFTGGSGADRFVFALDSGDDQVLDFADNNVASDDRIDLSAYGFASAKDIGKTADGDDLILDLGGGDTIRLDGYLENHTIKQINDDFVL